MFDEIVFSEGLRLDVLVNDLVICELKALETVNPVWQAQILSHLKLTRANALKKGIHAHGLKRFAGFCFDLAIKLDSNSLLYQCDF